MYPLLIACPASQEIYPSDPMLCLIIHSPLDILRLSNNERIVDVGVLKIRKDLLRFIDPAFALSCR
jgi:hypothetical protein